MDIILSLEESVSDFNIIINSDGWLVIPIYQLEMTEKCAYRLLDQLIQKLQDKRNQRNPIWNTDIQHTGLENV